MLENINIIVVENSCLLIYLWGGGELCSGFVE